jgi:glutathione S-transferase
MREAQRSMKLYDYPPAPSPRKVRLFIAEKGIDVPVAVVDLRASEHKTPEFVAKNPSATVPVLELDDGTCLTESLAICHYLEQLYPEPNLMGADAREQALVLMWNDIATLEGYLAIQEAWRNSAEGFRGRPLPGLASYEQIPALAERGRRRSEVFFDRLEGRLAGSPFVALDRFSYADIVAFVYLGFAARAFKDDPGAARPSLARWRDAIAARSAIRASD